MEETNGIEKKVFSVGKLVNFSWKLGMSCESSNCAEVNSPFVSISMDILNEEGKKVSHFFELTIPEFQVNK